MNAASDAESDFLDSNIWLYAFVEAGDRTKQSVAAALTERPGCTLSTQVVNEICANLRRKAGFSEAQITEIIGALYREHRVMPVEIGTMLLASRLRTRYSLSFWDSLIVASALEAGCPRIYTEDLSNGQLIEGTLTVVNPFRER